MNDRSRLSNKSIQRGVGFASPVSRIMKLPLLLLALVTSCQAAKEPATPIEPEEPEILFRGFEYGEEGETNYAVFALANPTSDEYTYRHLFGPVFFTYDLGRLRPIFWGSFCGTGITDHTLHPNEVVPLPVWINDAVGPIQVRMDIRNQDGAVIELTSAAVDITTGKANNGLERASHSALRR